MIIKAYAKLNFTLDVLFKRADGYHELESLMHALSLHDAVEVIREKGVSVTANAPLPEDNTAYRAALWFERRFGEGARIHIQKDIPSQAGLGGASADAAAVLYGMCALYGRPLNEEVYAAGRDVGADVPFCLYAIENDGGCALARGVGERLTPLPRIPLWLTLAKGAGGVSTKALFSSLALPVRHPDTQRAVKAVRAGDAAALGGLLYNALEPAATRLQPEIARLRARLEALGGAACMTGSGSTVFGLMPGEAAARAAAKSVDAEFSRAVRTL